MHTLRIGVLMGGKSQEREVSLNSGRTVCDHLDTSCYRIIPLFQTKTGALYKMPMHFLHRGKTSDFEHRLEAEAEPIAWDDLKKTVDFVYIAQHGRYAEDGSLQGFLEILRIPYCGSKVFTSALSMDKVMQRSFLKAANIDVPQAVIVEPHEAYTNTPPFGFPCVVKPAHEGSSLGVSVVNNKEELTEAIIKAKTVTPGIKQKVLIEEYIKGMEFSCIVITDYNTHTFVPLPPTEIVLNPGTTYFDYEQKYMPGKAIKHTPARCTKEQEKHIQETCLNVMNALNIHNLGRIDGILTHDNRVVIIDPNTFSGMDPASLAFLQAAQINMSHTQFINHLIATELQSYNMLTLQELITGNTTMNKETNKLRVGVLLGGQSNEKEISLASGRNVLYKLSPQKYEAIPLFLSSNLELYRIDQSLLVRNTTAEIETELTPAMKVLWQDLPTIIDFAFIGLHGGHGENGCIQGLLETLSIPYNGSGVLASALCMDKWKTKQLLQEHSIPVPKGILIEAHSWHKNPEKYELPPYPLIVKPHDDGCSVLVKKVMNPTALKKAIKEVFDSGKNTVLVEECIEGIELTVGVVGNSLCRALPASMAISQAGVLSIEEKFLPGAGENQTPAPIPPQAAVLVAKTMEDTYKATGCAGYARIDCFYQPADISPTKTDRVVVLELNTLPGLTPATCLFHQASEWGLRPMDFIDLIIQLGIELHAPRLTNQIIDLTTLSTQDGIQLRQTFDSKE